MVGPIQVKTFHTLTTFSRKSPSSFSLSFAKLKTLVHTLIFTHFRHVTGTFAAKTKSILTQLLNKIQLIRFIGYLKKNNKKNTRIFGSFRFHYNWGSSHVLPVPPHVLGECHVYYDPTWNSIVAAECDDKAEAELSGYLHWLEEQVNENSTTTCDHRDEIDRLADMFIASCHEKFKLEKEESYRRFQEMMDRSV